MTTLTEHPRVALRPAPAYDPPFDDERGPARWLPDTQPAPPPVPPTPGPRSAARRPDDPGGQRPAGTSGVATPAGDPSPETRSAAAWFLNTCLEILNGYRPVAHLRTLSSPARAGAVTEAMAIAVRRVARGAGAGRAGARRGQVRLRRMRVCEPSPGVAEICAVLGLTGGGAAQEAGRCWAAAFRLERSQGQWRCTVARLL